MNCPNCGAVTDSFHQFCSSCGADMNTKKETNAAKELAERLLKIEEDNRPKGVVDSVFKTVKNLSNTSKISDIDNQKISLINNFTISGNKTDIIEMLLMARSNVETYSGLLNNSKDLKQKEINTAYLEAWKSKLDQALSLGKIHLASDSDFLRIKGDIDKEKEEAERALALKKKKEKMTLIGFGALFVFLFGLLAIMGSISDSDKDNSLSDSASGIPVSINIECVPNLVFSKYDVDIKIDDQKFERLTHGTTQVFTAYLPVGTHKMTFYEAATTPVKGSIEFNVQEGTSLSYKIYCYDDYITIKDLNNPDEQTEEESVVQSSVSETSKAEATTKSSSSSKTRPASYHSSNDRDIAKTGDNGVYAYKKTAKEYEIYYIIDFDNNCVYYFTDGPAGDGSYLKGSIVSGNLNDGLYVKYKDGEDEWEENLHFKYFQMPDKLIMIDHNYLDYEFIPTDVNKALGIKRTKTIM